MHEPIEFGWLFGFDVIGDNNVVLINHVKGSLSAFHIFGINVGEVKDSSAVTRRGSEGCNRTFGSFILIGIFGWIEHEGVVTFGSDAVKFPFLTLVAVSLIGLTFGTRVNGPSFSQGFEDECALIEMAVTAEVVIATGLNA